MKKNLMIVGAVVLVIIAIVLINMKPKEVKTLSQPEVRQPGELLTGEVRGVIGVGETQSPEDMAGAVKVAPPVKR